nr:Trifunctional nucleotide phosphoesterase protein YfkNprecursor [Candidatus Pantoea persica]
MELESYTLVLVNLKHKIKNADGSESWLTWQQEIPKNSTMMKLLMPYQKRSEGCLSVEVGATRGQVRFTQTNLGQQILRAQMAKTQADFAVISGGGIRALLPVGKLSWRDLLQVQPFGNQVVSVTLTGAEVKTYLDAVANIKPDAGGFTQFANVSLVRDGETVSDVRINGQPLQAKKNYRLVTNSFNAAGGDGYPRLDTHAGYQNSGAIDAEVLRDYVKAHSPLNAADYAPKETIRTLTEAEKTSRETPHKRSYLQMILAWIWPWGHETAQRAP